MARERDWWQSRVTACCWCASTGCLSTGFRGKFPAAAAVRECLEETGIRCANPRPLLFYHTGLDTVYNPTYLFYSDEIAGVHEPQSIHQQEVNSSEWLPLTGCLEMITAGQIQDNFTIAALLAYRVLRGCG